MESVDHYLCGSSGNRFCVYDDALCQAWKETRYEEQMMGEYPESAASGVLAISVLFLTSIIMAAPWPLCPVILIGVLVLDKIQRKKDKQKEGL